MSLIEHVRDLTGIDDALVPDGVIEGALLAARCWTHAPVVWLTATRGEARVRGVIDTTEAVLVDAAGVEVDREAVGVSLDARGGVVLDESPPSAPVWTLHAYAYDVLDVAATACDAAAAALATAFDFSADGQSFDRSQQADAYRASADSFREQARAAAGVRVVPARRTDDDEAANPMRRRGRR